MTKVLANREMRTLIRQTLAASYDASALTGDFAVAGVPREERELQAASVLVPLIEHEDHISVLLTQRTDHLLHHPGQISFPGGRAEDDDEDPVVTALREAHEEIGLAPEQVEIVGFLDAYQTVTGFLVNPVVAFVDPGFQPRPDPFEVAEVFEVPLSFILNPNNHRRDSRIYNGQRRYFYVLPYKHYFIWGATAAILVGFYRKLAPFLNSAE